MPDLKESKPKKPVRYMDFVSHKPLANADPLASRPAARQVKPAPAPVKKPLSVADQIPKHATSSAKPAPAKPTAKPAPAKEPELAVKKTEQKPFISRQPAQSRDLYPEPKPAQPAGKPLDDLALKASAALSGTAQPAAKPSAPDNNAYSLSGKSPFLPNYNVDKRPLSNSVPPKKKDGSFEKLSFLGVSDQPADSSRKKNVYEKPAPSDKDKKSKKDKGQKSVKIIDDTKKKRGIPVWFIIIITILLGAAAGAGVYFLLPK